MGVELRFPCPVHGVGAPAGPRPIPRVLASIPSAQSSASAWSAMDTSAGSPCSSPLHADVPRYLPHVWAHVSLAPGVPRGLGFLSHPPTVAYPVDTSAPGGLFRGARHGVTPFRPSVWRGTEDPPLRRVARECLCVGCRPAQPISV